MRLRELASKLRSPLLAAALLAALGILLAAVHRHYPIQHWLWWRYASYWLLAGYFTLGCLVLGHACLIAVRRRLLPIREQLVLAFPLGLLAYFFIAFLAGLLGLFGWGFALAIPLAMLAVGIKPAFRYARRLRRHLRYAGARRRSRTWTWTYPVVAFGFVCVCLVYFSILHPHNASYDARWYHLPLAEQYVDEGRILRFPEGWVMGTYPQLSSLMYAWAFMWPSRLFDKVELSAHLEFVVFLWTLAAVPALARRLIGRRRGSQPRLSHAWVAVFLFPGLFLYDSSLNVSADHVAALWAIPIFSSLFLAWQRLDVRNSVLLAAFLSGALLTKYTVALVVAFPVIALVFRGLWLVVGWLRKRNRSPLPGLLATVVSGLLLTSPHWLKNWIWYGDPLYPQLRNVLGAHPWVPEAEIPYRFDIAVPWYATRDLDGVIDALRVTATYAFEHHDWPDLHGPAPIFGFLFTLTVIALPFLGFRPRLWSVYAAGHFGVFVWCFISWQDRYLQILVPWMAAAVAGFVALVWRMGWIPRLPALALLGAQVVWGSDAYFFPTHRIVGSPAKLSMDLIDTGRRGKYLERFNVFEPLLSLSRVLPSDAIVLTHESRQTFGMRRRRVHDRPGTQGALYYNRFGSPREVYEKLEQFGVTHLVWSPPSGIDTVGAELVFYDFVARFAEAPRGIGGLTLAEMPRQKPTRQPFGEWVGYVACDRRYISGLYQRRNLDVSPFDPKPVYPPPDQAFPYDISLNDLLDRADYLVVGKCTDGIPRHALRRWKRIVQRGNLAFYMKPPVAG